MSFFKRLGNRMKRDLTGRSIKNAVKSAEGMVKGLKGGGDSGSSQTPDRGPQFTDAARSQAAGAGTVGFTQRTQNW